MAPVTQSVLGGHMPQQSSIAWLSLVPISKARSSYNGLLVFLFIAAVGFFRRVLSIHRLASRQTRRAPVWDCGFPDRNSGSRNIPREASPSRSGACSARCCSAPASRSRCRRRATCSPARFTVKLDDIVWDWLYAPLAESVRLTADRLNVLQFLTIRRYLSLVFATLWSFCCWWSRYGADPRSRRSGRCRCCWCCCWRRW